jgi:hypothetical protein
MHDQKKVPAHAQGFSNDFDKFIFDFSGFFGFVAGVHTWKTCRGSVKPALRFRPDWASLVLINQLLDT